MKRLALIVFLGCALGVDLAAAQPGSGGCVAGASAAANPCPPTSGGRPPGMGPGMQGPGMQGPGMAGPGMTGPARAPAGADNTPGWALMSPQEQREHRERMQSFGNYAACAAYRDQHRGQMAARAAQRHSPTPLGARRDACEGLPR